MRPRGGFPEFERPEGVATLVVDPSTGQLASDGCPYRKSEVFVERFAPREVCLQHAGWSGGYDDRGWAGARDRAGCTGERERERRRQGGFRGWLDRVRGEEEEGEEEPREEPPPDDPN